MRFSFRGGIFGPTIGEDNVNINVIRAVRVELRGKRDLFQEV